MSFSNVLNEDQMLMIGKVLESSEIRVADKINLISFIKTFLQTLKFCNFDNYDDIHDVVELYVTDVPNGAYYVFISTEDFKTLNEINWNGMILYADRIPLLKVLASMHDASVYRFSMDNFRME